jgi:hypothetical protein
MGVKAGNLEQVFPIFVGVWVALALSSAAFFVLSKNVRLKRKVWPPVLVFTGALFIALVWATGLPSPLALLAVLGVALMIYLNRHAVQFCDTCGAATLSQSAFTRPEACSSCRAPLKE